MEIFTVKEESLSYKYLYKFNKKFRGAVYDVRHYDEYDSLPKDFCAYWRKVASLASFHFSLFIAALIELKFVWFALTNYSLVSNDKLLHAQPWYIQLEFLMGAIGSVALSLVAIVGTLYYGIGFVSKFLDKIGFLSFIGSHLEAAADKRHANKMKKYQKSLIVKPDGLLKTWYKSYKEKHCALAKFEISKGEKGKPWWYNEDGSDQSEVDDGYEPTPSESDETELHKE